MYFITFIYRYLSLRGITPDIGQSPALGNQCPALTVEPGNTGHFHVVLLYIILLKMDICIALFYIKYILHLVKLAYCLL